jgi:hypothetical protein
MARCVSLFLVLVLLVALIPGGAMAQAPTPPPGAAPGTHEPKPPIFQYFLAGGVLALIAAIVCMPTRKSR